MDSTDRPDQPDQPDHSDQPDQPNSICHVQPIQMYPLPKKDEEIEVPFKVLTGEAVFHHGQTENGLIILTNYRLYLELVHNHHHLPIGLIEVVEHRELFYIHIGCKDARTYRCVFANNETCTEWYDWLTKASTAPKQMEQSFAFYHFIWSKDAGGDEVNERIKNLKQYTFDQRLFRSEMDRLGFEGDAWRISQANENHRLCPSYPPYLIVPSSINDDTLEAVAKFRSSRRIPAVVWRHVGNGAVIARCSQPEVGWLGWRSSHDEELIKAISEACSFDTIRNDKESLLSHSPGSLYSDDSLQITTPITQKEKPRQVLIMDARSYTTAVANRARGGGCECPEYYPNCEIQFMNLVNIHAIRKSFHALRSLCVAPADQPNWFSQLEATRWLQNMSALMKASVTLVKAVELEARPVLVHCSDGWDRTPQIIALAELLLDPYYRTIDGFRILIEREWLAYGHKFADRCGQSTGSLDINERCPVFLQWLDCVHQLLLQYSCAFEFSQTYLVKLAQHIYSNLYGTFLCNTFQDRNRIANGKTFSVWEFLNSPRFRNHLYTPSSSSTRVLWPQCNLRDLQLWNEVYLGLWEMNLSAEGGSGSCPGPPESSPSHMTKTRSYGDLLNTLDVGPSQIRRSSDPSINIDKKLSVLSSDTLSQEATASTQDIVNGNETTLPASAVQQQQQNGDFLYNETDTSECNKDCILFNEVDNNHRPNFLTNNSEVESTRTDFNNAGNVFLTDHVINGDKTDTDECDGVVPSVLNNVSSTNGVSNTPSYNNSNDVESDNEVTEKSESRSEYTIHEYNGFPESIQTSTDTLVSDNLNFSSSPSDINGFEKLQSPIENIGPTRTYFNAQQLKYPISTHNGHNNRNRDLAQSSRYSNSPFYSRTSSCSGWDSGLPQHKTWQQNQPFKLGEDGLIPVISAAQERLLQIIQEHKRKEELLEKELYVYRQALMKQSCHRCPADIERVDDAGSVAGSVYSAGEGQASAVESLRSDMSWEALEENSILTECTATLWVPDHAVSRCTGCQTEFWVGKRKHHCRKCGRIFCASCSENSTPLPSEQLYNPVRVCTGCYSKLRRDCGELIPDQCKQGTGQATTSNPQIAASSN